MTAVKYVSSVVLAAVIVFTGVVNCGNNEETALESYSLSGFIGGTAEIVYDSPSEGVSSDNDELPAASGSSGESNISSSTDSASASSASASSSSSLTSTTATISSTTLATTTAVAFSASDYINDITSCVNSERSAAGVSRLKTDSALASAAQKRAEELAGINTLRPNGKSHVRPDGSPWYTVLGVAKGENYNYGENLISGYFTASVFVEKWMGSSGHKQNIIDSEYTHTGVGCARADNGMIYCVQIFYRPY